MINQNSTSGGFCSNGHVWITSGTVKVKNGDRCSCGIKTWKEYQPNQNEKWMCTGLYIKEPQPDAFPFEKMPNDRSLPKQQGVQADEVRISQLDDVKKLFKEMKEQRDALRQGWINQLLEAAHDGSIGSFGFTFIEDAEAYVDAEAQRLMGPVTSAEGCTKHLNIESYRYCVCKNCTKTGEGPQIASKRLAEY